MSAYHQAEGKYSSFGALHNENIAACESDAGETEVRISWTPEAEV